MIVFFRGVGRVNFELFVCFLVYFGCGVRVRNVFGVIFVFVVLGVYIFVVRLGG